MSTEKGSMSVTDSFEDLMDSLNQRESVDSPVDVMEDLPSRARMKDGDLVVSNITPTDEEWTTLTSLRKNIIRAVKENPDKTQEEIGSIVGCNSTSVSRTCRNFKFLLEDDEFYKSFVSPRLQIKTDKKSQQKETNEVEESNKPNSDKESESEFTDDEKFIIVKSLIINEEDDLAKRVLDLMN